MFKPGTRVVYPMQGIGSIIEILHKKIGGERGYFYMLMLDKKNAKILIPVKQTKKVGLRKIISKAQVDKVIKILKSNLELSSLSWAKRFKNNFLLLKSGSIFKVSAVLRELAIRNKIKPLSNIERSLFKKAYELVAQELAEVKKMERKKIETIVNRTLAK